MVAINRSQYKIFIPCAGIGSRLSNHCQHINKTLLPIDNKPILSHIIDKFDASIEIVMSLGYKGNLIVEFLSLAYPDRKFRFIRVDPNDGPASGLTNAIMCCKNQLQCPFIFITNDAILLDKYIPTPLEQNWVGYADIEAGELYRSVGKDPWNSDIITNIYEKGKHPDLRAYIGVCGINDYETFWETIGACKDRDRGEAFALNHLKLFGKCFKWLDTGTEESFNYADKKLRSNDEINILPKQNESIWFCNERVIKFSTNREFIKNRVNRANILKGFVPDIICSTDNMYAYNYVHGNVLSGKNIDTNLFELYLNFITEMWDSQQHINVNLEHFSNTCLKFYKHKTIKRITKYMDQNNPLDCQIINGIDTENTIMNLLSLIDWSKLTNGRAGIIHGDLHFENTIYNSDNKKFKLIDHRQSFGNFINIGDIYYDLAKILHGLIVSHEIIRKNMFDVKTLGPNEIKIDIMRRQILLDCERYLYKFCKTNGYNWWKVKIITALIFLNIAPLHLEPPKYREFLFHLGKLLLFECLKYDQS